MKSHKKNLQKLYDDVYLKDYKSFFSKFVNGKDESGTNEILERTIDWKNKQVLDFGCGTGDTAAFLTELGSTITGIDYSAEAIELAENKNISNANFIKGSLEDIYKNYDIIISLGTLEHIDNPEKYVKVFSKHLKKDGSIIITCPNWTNPRGYILLTLHYLLHLKITLTDKHFVTLADITRWAEKAGLYIDNFLTFDYSRGLGEKMYADLIDRIPKIFKKTNIEYEKNLLEFVSWLKKSEFQLNGENEWSGSNAIYSLKKNE